VPVLFELSRERRMVLLVLTGAALSELHDGLTEPTYPEIGREVRGHHAWFATAAVILGPAFLVTTTVPGIDISAMASYT
jgi:hypothetical protein